MASNTASEVAESLLEEHGKDRALELVNSAIDEAHKAGDGSKEAVGNQYVLRVLRETKRILQRLK